VTRDQAVELIADLGYGRQNASDWVLSAAFSEDGAWAHPAGVIVITWDAATDSYDVTSR
jgi:hypothetical protein